MTVLPQTLIGPARPTLQSAFSCRFCRRWLEGEWGRAASDAERAELDRQMDQGYCDPCTSAVVEYLAELDALIRERRNR